MERKTRIEVKQIKVKRKSKAGADCSGLFLNPKAYHFSGCNPPLFFNEKEDLNSLFVNGF